MKICARCGEEYRCCKTGLIMHDADFHPDSRHQGDLFFCPSCKHIFINRAESDYFGETIEPQCTITHDAEEPVLWDRHFAKSILDHYGVDLYNA